MSNYPGNPALAAALQERVSSTFQQTLALYRAGRTAEVVSGCTLILQMDPMFDPAKKLLEKARNPAAPIDVDSLEPPAADTGALLREAREAMGGRDFQRVVQITTDILTNDLMNDEARVLSEEAREKMEAAPFVDQFVKKCEQHLAAGNVPAAEADLEKARSLDAHHPGVGRMQQMIAGAKRPAPAPPPPPPAPPAAPPKPPPAAAPSSFNFDSFVVDAPASGRGTAQASDFGFTFEEDKPAAPPQGQQPGGSGFGSGFSFDAPSPFSTSGPMPSPIPSDFSFDAPKKEAATGEFDFSTASIETSPADQQKIDQYLKDGDREFDAGNYQQAIDLWSRVFLIDVTNEQASERIERAKARRRDTDQKVDAAVAAGMQAFERKDIETARAQFTEALRLDPSNQAAKEQLDRISSGSPAPAAPRVPPPSAPEPKFDDIFADEALTSMDEPPVAIGEPSPVAIPTPRRAAAATPKAAPKPSRQAPVVPIAIVVGLLVLAAGGWFAWTKIMSKPASDPAATRAVITQATTLAQAGKYDQAIALLQDIKPNDPQHDRAIVMIAEMQRKKTQAAEMIDGRPAQAFYQDQVSAGRTAFQARDYDNAKKAFEQAMRVRSLPADAKQMYDTAAQQAAKLDSARALFNERQYQSAILNLQSLLQQDPQNKSIQRMILDAHFNLGAVALQEERLPDAVREFEAVLKVDPNDDLAKKSRDLAVRYNGVQKDLLYRIYVKYLPLRQMS